LLSKPPHALPARARGPFGVALGFLRTLAFNLRIPRRKPAHGLDPGVGLIGESSGGRQDTERLEVTEKLVDELNGFRIAGNGNVRAFVKVNGPAPAAMIASGPAVA
jgi:hypothetical protein